MLLRFTPSASSPPRPWPASLNSNSPQAHGLVGWWPDGQNSFFPRVPAFTVAASGAGNDYSPATATGQIGTIGSGFDGITGGVRIPGRRVYESMIQAQHPDSLHTMKSVFLSYWLYITTQANTVTSTTPYSQTGIRYASGNVGRLNFHYSTGTISRIFSSSSYTSVSGFRASRWNHIIHGCRVNASNSTLGMIGVSGQLASPSANTAAWTATNPTTIGGYEYGGTVYTQIDVVIGDVRLYAFNSDQVATAEMLSHAAFLPATRWDLWGRPKVWSISHVPAASTLFARPASDVSDGGWTPSTGADLYATIDETAASDTDYNTSGATPVADEGVVALTPMATPGAGTVTLRVRITQ